MRTEILLARIEQLCKEKGVNKTTAFKESGVGKNFVSNLQTSNPSIQKLTALANYFNVSVAYLTGEEDDETYARKIRSLVIKWLIDNDFSYEEDEHYNVSIEKNGKVLYFSDADFMNESLYIKKLSEKGFELAMADWVHKNFLPQQFEHSTPTLADQPFSEQERTLIRMFRETTEEGRFEMIASIVNIKSAIEKKHSGENPGNVGAI